MSTTYPASLMLPARAVEGFLREKLEARELPTSLRDAIAYALFGGGKRVRPALCVLSCEAVGGTAEAALPAAGALELVHGFSLVHDDLPAMDDDDLRRGRPTLHRHANEAMAILAGDAMTSIAFELLAEATHAAPLTRELAGATTDMIAGQVLDCGEEPRDPSEREEAFLRRIHRLKTGALIRAACRMGGISGGATASQLAALDDYASAVGLMFQVVDDLLDVTQSGEHLGKAAQKDAEAGKLTFPGLLGVEASRAEVRRLRQCAMEALCRVGASESLGELAEWLAVRTR